MDAERIEARVQALEAALSVALPDRPLALAALTHKSFCNEHRDLALRDNERLEFLGDAVVDLIVSDELMRRFPNANEGELSKLRARIVNEEGLAKVARSIGLGGLLLLGRGEELSGGREKASVLADALEAVIGAVYLTGGVTAAAGLVAQHFAEVLEGVAEGRSGEDFKTRLQEEVQTRLRVAPRYQVVSETGPDHAKTFEVEVMVGTELFARGVGRSKKEAEQASAQKTLAMLARLDKKA